MNPYVQTRVMLSLTHERMMQWVRDILIQAGFSSVKVFGSSPKKSLTAPTSS